MSRSRIGALLVLGSCSLGLVWPLLFVAVVGHVGEVFHWYTDGGSFMHLILVGIIVQGGATFLLGRDHLRRTPSPWPYFVAPVALIIMGWAGASVGLSRGSEAVPSAPVDMKLQLWTSALSIADNPLQLALFGVAFGTWGGMAALGLAAFLRRNDGPSRRGWGTLVPAFAVPVLIALGGTAYMLAARPGEGGFTLILMLCLPLLILAPLVGFAVTGVAAMARHPEQSARSSAFSIALGCAMLPPISALALQAALTSLAHSSAYSALASAPPELDSAHLGLSMAMQAAFAVRGPVPILMGAAQGAWVFLWALPALRGGLVLRPLVAGVCVLPLVALSSAPALLETQKERGVLDVVHAIRVPLPEQAELPVSSSELLPNRERAPFVTIIDGVPMYNLEALGDGFSPHSAQALAERLELPEQKEPQRVEESAESRFAALSSGRAEAASDERDDCRGMAALAMDGSTSLGSVRDALRWLRQAEVCRVELLTRRGVPPDADPDRVAELEAFETQRRAGWLEQGALGRVVLGHDEPYAVVNIVTTTEIPSAAPGQPPRALVHVRLDAQGVSIGADDLDARRDIPHQNGRIDRARVQRVLGELKDAFPDERDIYVSFSDPGSFQQLVYLLDTARELESATDRPVTMFDVVYLVVSD